MPLRAAERHRHAVHAQVRPAKPAAPVAACNRAHGCADILCAPAGGSGFLSTLALAPSGEVLALDIGHRQLRRFDPLLGSEAAPVQLSPPNEPSHWSDLAIDATGSAWVLDRRDGEISIVISGIFIASP